MDPMNEYFAHSDDRFQQQQWENPHWQNNIQHWNSTPIAREPPHWQYTGSVMENHGNPMGYYPNQIPLSPSYTSPSSTNSPVTAVFPQDVRYLPHQPMTLIQKNLRRPTQRPVSLQLPPTISVTEEPMEEDDESEDCSGEPRVTISKPRPMHRRTASANDLLSKSAKRAHTVVEKNYRERLNDKINDLAQYLFETSSDSRTKPSKSLVMTRAKERLKQLEARNSALEAEVASLKQRVAILDHVVATSENSQRRPVTRSKDVELENVVLGNVHETSSRMSFGGE